MKQHNNSYEFSDWTVSFAENGFIVKTIDGSYLPRTAVYTTFEEVVQDLADHCGLIKIGEQVLVKGSKDE